MAVNHYENFPVASWLCPARLRPAVIALYWFARTADDLADEGLATQAQRLSQLRAYEKALVHTIAGGDPEQTPWPSIFSPLQKTIAHYHLPTDALFALLSAFMQDLQAPHWPDAATLLDYCGRSANPIGRLLLHLYGCANAQTLNWSNHICSALQLINFWQDLSIDIPRKRLYIPDTALQAHGLCAQDLLQHPPDSVNTQALVKSLSTWARGMMLDGAPLIHHVPKRLGWELRFVIQGGLRILDRIENRQGATLHWRPQLRYRDGPILLWRACRMPSM